LAPGLEECLFNGSEEDIIHITSLVCLCHIIITVCMLSCGRKLQKGASAARANDMKTLKGAVLDWIMPRGGSLVPPLARNIKFGRGFHHECTGALLCPVNLNWSDTEYIVLFTMVHKQLMSFRIKERLRTGELATMGDEWPLFLYHSYVYDPNDPWNGLLCSCILVKVHLCLC
jgi:hypothetical protein